MIEEAPAGIHHYSMSRLKGDGGGRSGQEANASERERDFPTDLGWIDGVVLE